MSIDEVQTQVEALSEGDFQNLLAWINDEVDRRRAAGKIKEAVQEQQSKDAEALWEAHPELKPQVTTVDTPPTPVATTVEQAAAQLKILPYKQPTGAHDAYPKGAKFVYGGRIWETLINGYVWSPDAVGMDERYRRDVTAYFVSDTVADPVEEPPAEAPVDTPPEFKQPTGGHDAYKQGDKVTFNGAVYESLINANVWSPAAYPQGWKKL